MEEEILKIIFALSLILLFFMLFVFPFIYLTQYSPCDKYTHENLSTFINEYPSYIKCTNEETKYFFTYEFGTLFAYFAIITYVLYKLESRTPKRKFRSFF